MGASLSFSQWEAFSTAILLLKGAATRSQFTFAGAPAAVNENNDMRKLGPTLLESYCAMQNGEDHSRKLHRRLFDTPPD